MALPPQGSDLLQGHWTTVAASVGVFAQRNGQAPRTREQHRFDDVAGSFTTSWTTHIDETDGPGLVSIVSNNPGSAYGGNFRITIDGTILYSETRAPGELCVGLVWAADLGNETFVPLFFRTTFKFETARTTSSFDFNWNAVYTLIDWS